MLGIRKKRYGFTLIELLMVMVVLAVIAAIVIPKFYDRNKQAKEAALKSDLKVMRNAIASFQADTGYYPLTLNDLTVTAVGSLSTPNKGIDSSAANQTINATDFHGPYIMNSVPTDPVSKSAFTYSTTAGTVGNITSSAAGNGLDGTAYSTW
jgi:general secretion pathway protein G